MTMVWKTVVLNTHFSKLYLNVTEDIEYICNNKVIFDIINRLEFLLYQSFK